MSKDGRARASRCLKNEGDKSRRTKNMRTSPAQILIGLIGIMMAAGVFCLMRFTGTRRPQFREHGSFSLKFSLFASVAVLVLIFLMILIQGLWERTL
jgi:hypothetical protein